jgi:Asp-tRNA(Asn)/Glu-tRNA(Gln) amidotransferase A subunit family amidase
MDRRQFISSCAAAGLGGTLLPGVLWAQTQASGAETITPDMIAAAEKIAGLEFTPQEREQLARSLGALRRNFATLRAVPLANSTPPALRFDPVLPGMTFATERRPPVFSEGPLPELPADLEELAFWSALDLGRAVREKKVSSSALTKMYLDRLKRFDPVLKCVVTLTEERALAQAQRADDEIASGKVRGPLHGVPWGAKDLLAAKGYPTTWGATPFREQRIEEDATVVSRLDEAGAVLIAKLSLGELAQGDQWFGGQTKNPWNPQAGSSGSSAGPASATSAGLVGFAIGSETNGSIASPCTVCGVTGLRPTFGRVSRHGAMALSWTMDKLGPIGRTAEDCAAVLSIIHGADGRDPTAVDLPFNFDATSDVTKLRVGYVREAFEEAQDKEGLRRKALDDVRALGVTLSPIDLPALPYNDMGFILMAEAAAAFDDLTRSNRDDELHNQGGTDWPGAFRRSRFIPAVEYIQAMRVRTMLMRQMAALMDTVDLYLTPATVSLYLTNFSGHPLLVLPSGFTTRGTPASIGMVGRLYGEAELCALGRVYQAATGHHLKHPALRA